MINLISYMNYLSTELKVNTADIMAVCKLRLVPVKDYETMKQW